MKPAVRPAAAIALLAVAGMLLSAVALVNHYGSTPSAYCDFGESFNCDIVNRSIYSQLAGVPVALLGLLGYALILVVSRLGARNSRAALVLFAGSLAGVAFALYLTYLEAVVLAVWCILCISSQLVILAIAILAGVVLRRWRHMPPAGPPPPPEES